MSQPRPVVAGATYFITRRTVLRHHLLRPDAAMHAVVTYVLAVASARFGVTVHGYVTMSTHIHLVVTDVEGRLPSFVAMFHRLVAMATKVLRKWEGAVWDAAQTSYVRLETGEAVVDKLAYVIANPVAAGLVRTANEWPGAKSCVSELGTGVQRAARPDAWLDPDEWPDYAELRLAPPPDVAPRDVIEWREVVAGLIRDREQSARADLRETGRSFAGPERLRRMSPFARARTAEPLRERNPTFAVGRVRGAYSMAVEVLRAFRSAYRAALRRWREGVRDVVFPAGTWWMARVHSVIVHT